MPIDAHTPPPPPQGQQRFTWPPRAPTQNPTQLGAGSASLAPPEATPSARPHAHPWQIIEETLLGVTTPPLHRRLAAASARPDPLDSFCWRCARSVGPYETDARGCSHCRATRLPWDRAVRLAQYAEPWRSIVHDAKFTAWPALARDAGRLLGRQARPLIDAAPALPTIVVPVPMATRRRLMRGTDHALNIARGFAAELRLPLRRLLSRQARPEQNRLPRTERLTNLRGSMSRHWLDRLLAPARLTPGHRWPGPRRSAGTLPDGELPSARLILVDDISTTGATIAEAAKTARSICKHLQIQDLEIVAAVICKVEPRPVAARTGNT